MANYPSEQEGARAFGRYLPISTKHSVAICNSIRYKPLLRAERFLQEVLDEKKAVPFTRGRSTPHKPGMGPGRYPLKATGMILNILQSARKNALSKNMNEKDLKIVHISAHKAARPMKYGRVRGRSKKTHVYVIVSEYKKKENTEKKVESKIDHKVEHKVEPKTHVVKK